MNHCPICDSSRVSSFLQRQSVPVHQNLVVYESSDAKNVNRGQLNMVLCLQCGFVWNNSFDESLLVYGDGYDNNQACSPHFENYLNELVQKLVEDKGIKNSHIVEVGCGQGYFLDKLVHYPNSGNKGTGFDPTCRTNDYKNLRFVKSYYDKNASGVHADIVLCRHVIEHVPNPLYLLRSVAEALSQSPDARVFFETPCVEWILKNQVIWDFFYEHCSLFSKESIRYAFEKSGFVVDSVCHVFEGQYLWLEARLSRQVGHIRDSTDTSSLVQMASDYTCKEGSLIQEWTEMLKQHSLDGKVCVWGAGAKGVTFVNLVDPHGQLLDCVVDINPNKQGAFVPGTGHRIVGPDKLPQRNVKYAVLMNPNYRAENEKALMDMNYKIRFIDWSQG